MSNTVMSNDQRISLPMSGGITLQAMSKSFDEIIQSCYRYQSNVLSQFDDVNVIRPTLRSISLFEGVAAEKTIRLKVEREGTDPILFQMRMSSPMKRLMSRFSKEAKMGLEGLRFVVDGKRIQEDDTPNSLELENDDLIEVFQYQLGGR